MKKEYEKPILEVIEFEYDVSAETSVVGVADYNVGNSTNWWS